MPEHETYRPRRGLRPPRAGHHQRSPPRPVPARPSPAPGDAGVPEPDAVAVVAVLAVGRRGRRPGTVESQRLRSHRPTRCPPPHRWTADAPRRPRPTAGRLGLGGEHRGDVSRKTLQVAVDDDCFPSSSGQAGRGSRGVRQRPRRPGGDHDERLHQRRRAGAPVVLQRMVSDMEGCAQKVDSFTGPSGVVGYTYQVPPTTLRVGSRVRLDRGHGSGHRGAEDPAARATRCPPAERHGGHPTRSLPPSSSGWSTVTYGRTGRVQRIDPTRERRPGVGAGARTGAHRLVDPVEPPAATGCVAASASITTRLRGKARGERPGQRVDGQCGR